MFLTFLVFKSQNGDFCPSSPHPLLPAPRLHVVATGGHHHAPSPCQGHQASEKDWVKEEVSPKPKFLSPEEELTQHHPEILLAPPEQQEPLEVTSNLGLMAAALRGGAEMLAPLCTFTTSQVSVTSSCLNRL